MVAPPPLSAVPDAMPFLLKDSLTPFSSFSIHQDKHSYTSVSSTSRLFSPAWCFQSATYFLLTIPDILVLLLVLLAFLFIVLARLSPIACLGTPLREAFPSHTSYFRAARPSGSQRNKEETMRIAAACRG